MRRLFMITAALAGWLAAGLIATHAAPLNDFALGQNAEGQTCRAQVKFSGVAPGRSADLYCGAWERPSGSVFALSSKDDARATALMVENCSGRNQALTSNTLGPARQTFCGSGAGSGRLGIDATVNGTRIVGWAYPSDWAALVRSAEVLAGVAKAQSVARAADTPGMSEIRAVYPDGPPGQGAELNYTLLKRRAYENNLAFNFSASERDFSELLRAHHKVFPDDVAGEADILAEMGLNQSNARRFDDATETLARAFSEAEAAKDLLTRSKILNYQAINQLNQRQYARALELLGDAEKLRAAPELARLLAERGELAAAQSILIEGSGTDERERLILLSAQGFYLKGVAAGRLGRADAEAAFTAALDRLQLTENPPAWLSSQIAGERARLRLRRGDGAGARGAVEEGLRQVRASSPGTRAEAQLLLIAAECEAALGSMPAEQQRADQAMAIFAAQRESPGLPPDLAAPHLEALLKSWSASHDAPAAEAYFRALALVWDGGAANSAAQLAARLGSGEAAEQTRNFQDAERAYRAALAARERLNDQKADAATIARADAQAEAASKALTKAEAALRSASPRYLELLRPTVTAETVRKALAPAEGYLRIVQGSDAAYGALVTSAGVTPFRIALGERDVDALVARVRKTTRYVGGRLPDYDLKDSAALFQAVIGPVWPELKTIKELQVDAGGPLAAAPFAALPVAAPSVEVARKIADAQDYSGVDWLARHLALAVSVGPASFQSLRAAKPIAKPLRFIGFGDFRSAPQEVAERLARLRDLTPRCKAEVETALTRLPALPTTADEAKAAGKLFGDSASLLIGKDFTDDAFFADPEIGDATVLLLATHGVLGLSGCFAEPALLTSLGAKGDGLIEASRLLDRRLNARLVIMSACDTAGGAKLDAARTGLTDGGEALSGLARAFLYAGATDVLATQWKVDAAASAKQVGTLLRTALDGKPLGAALAEAQRAAYDDPETAHPFYWSGFILVGDGGVRLPTPAARPVQSGS